MRINKYLALHTSLSRRAADVAISAGRVTLNGQSADVGDTVDVNDQVTLDGRAITPDVNTITIMLNKPVGYVCSRKGQGSQTIYELLPAEYQQLQPVGRLDKDSSGLLLLTNDGELANQLTHPRYGKVKLYEVTLDKPLQPLHQQMISDLGVTLEDGPSRFAIAKLEARDKLEIRDKSQDTSGEKLPQNGSTKAIYDSPRYEVTMREGRNRQIRRTFAALGYKVTQLHRTNLGNYRLGQLAAGKTELLNS